MYFVHFQIKKNKILKKHNIIKCSYKLRLCEKSLFLFILDVLKGISLCKYNTKKTGLLL